MQSEREVCRHCGGSMEVVSGVPLCPRCNDLRGEYYNYFTQSISEYGDQADRVMIECHGATLYHPGTDTVIAGVRFDESPNSSCTFEIVAHPVFGPDHVRHRWVQKDDARLIRRCQSCQDYTVRMRRKEGPDLYIPSRKKPQRPANLLDSAKNGRL